MAITTQFLTGFENDSTITAGGGVFTAWVGAIAFASGGGPRNGSYALRMANSANLAQNATVPAFSGATKVVGRFAIKASARPSSGVATLGYVVGASGDVWTLQTSSTGALSAFLIGGATQTGPTLDTTTWHLIEFQIDVTAKTADWKVDGVLQTRCTTASAPQTPASFIFGTKATTEPAYTCDYDDFISGSWTTPADWYGDGKVLAQLPGSDGTHATITSLSPGDAGTAYSGTVTTAYTMVDDAPGTGGWTATRSTTDNLSLRTATVGAYAEVKPAATAQTGQANAVRAIMSYSSSTTTANLAACDVRNSANVVTELWGLTGGVGKAYNIVANQVKGGIVTAPAAGWTATEVNLVRLRFGGCTSADISPVPTVQAMMLEVDWPIVGPRTATDTVTISDSSVQRNLDFRRTADDINPLSDDGAQRNLDFRRTADDISPLSDSAVGVVPIKRTASDSWSVSDRAAPPSRYAAMVLTDGPALYWRMGDATGATVKDSSPNGRNGTIQSTPLSVPGLLLGGDNDTALRFDGVDDKVDNAGYLAAAGTRTFEGWINRLDSTTGQIGFFNIGGGARLAIYALGPGDVSFRTRQVADQATWTNAAPTGLNAVFHWALVTDAFTAELFINGVSNGIKTISTNPGWAGGNSVGFGYITDDGFSKAIFDEFAIYEKALTPQQIRTHYEVGAGLVAAGDTVAVTDSATRFSTQVRPATDTVAFSDAATNVAGRQSSATDAVVFSDTTGRVVTSVRPSTDSWTVGDTAIRVEVFIRPSADSWTLSDIVVGTVSSSSASMMIVTVI